MAARIGTPERWATRAATIERGHLSAIDAAAVDSWFSAGYRERHPDDWTGWRTMLLRTSKDGYLATCAAVRDADLCRAAAAIRAPSLCLRGDA